MSETLFRNIRIVDARQELQGDLLVRDGKIAAVGENLETTGRVIDGAGHTLMPSFVDLHVHFRDPGLTHKEDVHTGSRAAVHGGYTYVNAMANTKPVCSSAETARYVREKAKELGICDVHQTVAVTKDFDGVTIDHLDTLDEGVKWLSDDGMGVQDTGTMLRAMEKIRDSGRGIMIHAEDNALTKVDSYLMEELETFRDVKLAQLTGCRTHFCHVSTIEAMDHILNAKEQGATNITLEVSPHHLLLNDENPGKVAPPLRGEKHRQYMVACVKKGLVDAIATDHAPHTAEEKQAGANGFTGLDTAFSACYTALVKDGHIDMKQLSQIMSGSPASIMGLENKGKIAVGADADLVVVDTAASYVVDESRIHSRSKNSPVMGQTLYGEVILTMKEGTVVYEKQTD